MTTNAEILDKIQIEIGQWSQTNFGDQVSKLTNFPLGATAPLLGLFEEYGELLETEDKFNDETKLETLDAIGDTCIYLLDFAGRSGISLVKYWISHTPDAELEKCDPYVRVGITIGRLAHVSLKSHQGIRQNETPLDDRLGAACVEVLLALEAVCQELPNTLLIAVTQTTWNTVKKRNWKDNPTSGN